LYSGLKIITGDNIIDTFEYGLRGNITANIDPEGVLESAVTFPRKSPKIIVYDTHPDSGVRFEGFQVPLWDELCSLMDDVAIKFLPFRNIGWDVAVTPKGVFIVEANIWGDPPNQFKILDKIITPIISDGKKDLISE
jgi:hypothetical protein